MVSRMGAQMAVQALHVIEPSVLLQAIRDGAKPKESTHLSPATEQLRAREAEINRLAHESEKEEARVTEKKLEWIRENAHHKVVVNLTDEQEHERDLLSKSFKLKHKQEAKEVKAARRRLEAIRKSAHCKVEDHLIVAAHENEQKKKQDHAREAKRELKAHQRRLKATTQRTGPRVHAWLDENTEAGRTQLARMRAEKRKDHLHSSRCVLKSHRAGSHEYSTAEVKYHAALLLQAARRGSLARNISTPPAEEGAPGSTTPSPRIRKAFANAMNNRLSMRRQAIVGQEIQGFAGLVAASAC